MPRTPAGPSEQTIGRRPSASAPWVRQASAPVSSSTLSCTDSSAMRSARSVVSGAVMSGWACPLVIAPPPSRRPLYWVVIVLEVVPPPRGPVPRSGDRREVEDRLLEVRRVRRRVHERVARRREPGVVPGGVLPPRRAVQQRGHRDLVGHDVLELADRGLLDRLAVAARVLGERLLGGRVVPPPDVGRGRLADRGGEVRVQVAVVDLVRRRTLVAPVDRGVEVAVADVARPDGRVADAVDGDVESETVQLLGDVLRV